MNSHKLSIHKNSINLMSMFNRKNMDTTWTYHGPDMDFNQTLIKRFTQNPESKEIY